MKLSKKSNILLYVLLLVLNIILRLQVLPRELGRDSFEMHVMANSLTEFGSAKWFLSPLSPFGLYPASYTSAMQFLLSGIRQCTNVEDNTVIFVYCVMLGFISIFAAHIMAKAFFEDDTFIFLASFLFSISPSILNNTTWTIPTRGLLIVLAPIGVYLALKTKDKMQLKYILMTILFSIFLLSTHHLFYFLLPMYVSAIIIIFYQKRKLFNFIDSITFNDSLKSIKWNFFKYLDQIIPIFGFLFMFSIPFFTGKFIESSRYAPVYISYLRYISIPAVFGFGGLIYLIFKRKKNINEWFILISAMFLTALIYRETYMKDFIIIISIFFICVGLLNALNTSIKTRYVSYFLILFLISYTSISGFYQFIHVSKGESAAGKEEKGIDAIRYSTGKWMKCNINGTCISNDLGASDEISSISDTVHFLTSSTITNQIYGFNSINITQYKRMPITSEDFWLNGMFNGPDQGEATWYAIQVLWESPKNYNITCVLENSDANGFMFWGHGPQESKLLESVYQNNKIYDVGNFKIWSID